MNSHMAGASADASAPAQFMMTAPVSTAARPARADSGAAQGAAAMTDSVAAASATPYHDRPCRSRVTAGSTVTIAKYCIPVVASTTRRPTVSGVNGRRNRAAHDGRAAGSAAPATRCAVTGAGYRPAGAAGSGVRPTSGPADGPATSAPARAEAVIHP